jgi:hypothetical protein
LSPSTIITSVSHGLNVDGKMAKKAQILLDGGPGVWYIENGK